MAFPDRYDYNQLVADVQDYCIKKEIRVPRWRRNPSEDEELAFHAQVLRALRDLDFQIAEEDRQGVAQEVAKRIVGMGMLQPFLDMEGVEEIIVRDGRVQVERMGQIQTMGDNGRLGPQADDDYYYRLARRIADLEGIELGAQTPQIKVGLPDGSRFTATIPPLSRAGTAINIRRFTQKGMTFDDLLEYGSLDEETIEFLKDAAASMRCSVVFSGRPAAGKTTWLNAFSQHLPPHAQVSCIETFKELDLHVEHPQRLIVEEDPEEMGQAINTVILRMRPDVLMIGEVVSREAMQYIIALNLGIVTHTTTHARSATFALTRLETLSGEADITLDQRRSIMGDRLLIIHLAKERDEKTKKYQRFMSELLAVTG
ncbi:MAG: CpaF family protein, partial [Planctomycetes bacterium]|nr:CpaF family protein [Planctomycetota bacterium]